MTRFSALTASAAVLLSVSLPAFAQVPTDAASMAEEAVDLTDTGDVSVASGRVNLSMPVEGDLVVAGGSVTVTSAVKGDARVAGGSVSIGGAVSGDLVVAGGTVKILKGATIDGDVIAFGGTIEVTGTVSGDLKARGGTVLIDGSVAQDVTVNGGELTVNGTISGKAELSADEISIGPKASFKGTVEYWTRSGTADFGKSVATGAAVYNRDLKDDGLTMMIDRKLTTGIVAGLTLVWTAISVLSAALLIFLFLLLPGDLFGIAAKRLTLAPWKSLLCGFAYIVLVPMILVTLAISVIGIPLALLGTAVYAFTLYAASAITALVCARWLQASYGKKWSKVTVFFVSLGLFVLLQLLWFVPVVGWILRMLLKLCAVGALLLAMREWLFPGKHHFWS